MIHRFEDWPARLEAWVRAAAARPFAWGQTDCCLAACDAVLAMTGVDLAAGLRGTYRTEREAYRALRRHAGGGVEAVAEMMATAHGIPEIRPATAQRGDVIMVGSTMPALGICLGASSAVVNLDGLAFVPTVAASRAWRI